MRIISGKFRGRRIDRVEDIKTRPTTDKNRESIFNIIGPYFQGGQALDLFAGSGAMGIEAISRGIDNCIFVDTSNSAIKVIKDNLSVLNISSFKIYQRDYRKVLKLLSKQEIKFDLIFLDPPYSFENINEIIELISRYELLCGDGIIVTESKKEENLFDGVNDISKIKEAIYGISKICVFRRDEIE